MSNRCGGSLRDAVDRRQQITIEISGNEFRELLTGNLAPVQRPGYVKIDFPPTEQWQSVLEGLPVHVSARIETSEFYQAIQQRITQRLCEQASASTSVLTDSG